jgi:hypothetical protein
MLIKQQLFRKNILKISRNNNESTVLRRLHFVLSLVLRRAILCWKAPLHPGFGLQIVYLKALSVGKKSAVDFDIPGEIARTLFEGARYGASQGFDTDSSTPVDLSGKEGVFDPNDLKQYDPPAPSLHTNPPPPLE